MKQKILVKVISSVLLHVSSKKTTSLIIIFMLLIKFTEYNNNTEMNEKISRKLDILKDKKNISISFPEKQGNQD